MLKQLYIKNFTLIDELNISLYPGFSVITGETGAGKSIILGAIGLLLGNRADSKAIKAGRDRCVIELTSISLDMVCRNSSMITISTMMPMIRSSEES